MHLTHSRSSVNLFLSISQCLAFSTALLPAWQQSLYTLVPRGWEDFSLGSVARRSLLSWLVSKLLTRGHEVQSWPVLGSRCSVPEFQACILRKSEPKSKEKWRNFLSGQNAIISPRATNLGRRSWFACACVINCICEWLRPHSGWKRTCWLSPAFVWHCIVFRAFSQYIVLPIPNQVSLRSTW